MHCRGAATSAHTAKSAPLRFLGPEATAVSSFVGSLWGSAVRGCEHCNTEETQPPSQVHPAELPVSALQFRIWGPLRGWGDPPAREGGDTFPLVGDPDWWLAEWPPWRKQSHSRSRGVGRTGPAHPRFRSRQASRPPVCPGPAVRPDLLRWPLCERLSGTGPALHPGDSGPAQKQADTGGATSVGRTVCRGLSAGAAGHVGALRGRHGERRLGGGPGKPTPPRPARLSPDPRGSDLGPALTPRDASAAGRIPAAVTSHPAAFPGTRLLSS